MKAVIIGGIVLFSASTALAGIATFAGAANDIDARIEGGWVSYDLEYDVVNDTDVPASHAITEGIACSHGTGITSSTYPGHAGKRNLYDESWTTNLTMLCGTRTLVDLGTITLILKNPNDNWTAWGAYIYPVLKVAGTELADNKTITFALGLDWTGDTIYIAFGTQIDGLTDSNPNRRPHWSHGCPAGTVSPSKPQFMGPTYSSPIGIRLSSDGTDLTFSWSKNGVDFILGGSWPINNLPGGLGNISGEQLEFEIGEYGAAATFCKLEWDAPTVPNLNGPGGDCQMDLTGCCPSDTVHCAAAQEGEGEGEVQGEGEGEGESQGEGEGEGEAPAEGEPEPTCEEGLLSVFETNVADYVGILGPSGYAVAYADWPETDLDSNGIPDKFEYAMLAYAMCKNPAVVAAYQSNLDAMEPHWTGGWTSFAVMHAAWGTVSQSMIDALQAYAWGVDGLIPYTDAKALNEPLSAEGDFDGDGYTNFQEYEFIAAQGGSPANYAYAASGGVAGPGLPVAGVLGLGLLAVAFAAGSARKFRSKK